MRLAATPTELNTKWWAMKDSNLAAANKSLELLGRHLRMFTDNLNLSGGLQITHEDALEQLK